MCVQIVCSSQPPQLPASPAASSDMLSARRPPDRGRRQEAPAFAAHPRFACAQERASPPCVRALSFSAARRFIARISISSPPDSNAIHSACQISTGRRRTRAASLGSRPTASQTSRGPQFLSCHTRRARLVLVYLFSPAAVARTTAAKGSHRRARSRTDAPRTLSASAVQSKPPWHMPGCSARSQRDRAAPCRAYQPALPVLRLSAYLHHEAASGDSAFAPQPPAQRAVPGRAHAGTRVLATRIASEVCIQTAWACTGRT